MCVPALKALKSVQEDSEEALRCGLANEEAHGSLGCCLRLLSGVAVVRQSAKHEAPVTALCQCDTMCHQPAGEGRFEWHRCCTAKQAQQAERILNRLAEFRSIQLTCSCLAQRVLGDAVAGLVTMLEPMQQLSPQEPLKAHEKPFFSVTARLEASATTLPLPVLDIGPWLQRQHPADCQVSF